jgi:predicted lipoprotein
MLKKLGFLFLIVLLASSCKKPEELESPSDTSFQSVLSNYALIIPNQYASFEDQSELLKQAAEALGTTPNASTLEQARIELEETRKAYQWICMYNFGPAEALNLNEVNTFPADTTAIQNQIDNGSVNGVNADEMGFAALDYMLHRSNALSEMTEASTAGTLLDRIVQCAGHIHSKAQSVRQEWNSSYASEFKANTGAAAGSGMSLLVNHYVICYEELKREKVALPLGLLTLGIPLPEHVEARYGGYSSSLALEQIKALSQTFNGFDSPELNAMGLADALREVDAKYGAEQIPLEVEINDRLAASESALSELPRNLRLYIESAPEELEQVYNQLQSNVALLKADMPSSLGISITFSDNDGD